MKFALSAACLVMVGASLAGCSSSTSSDSTAGTSSGASSEWCSQVNSDWQAFASTAEAAGASNDDSTSTNAAGLKEMQALKTAMGDEVPADVANALSNAISKMKLGADAETNQSPVPSLSAQMTSDVETIKVYIQEQCG